MEWRISTGRGGEFCDEVYDDVTFDPPQLS